MVKIVKDLAEFNGEIANDANKLFMVDFYADWCGPCKVIAPKFVKLSEDFTQVGFLKVNVDDSEDITEVYKIECMPTFIAIKNGKEIDRLSGANEAKLKQMIENNL